MPNFQHKLAKTPPETIVWMTNYTPQQRNIITDPCTNIYYL